MGYEHAIELLDATLDEENVADEMLTVIADSYETEVEY
jgi:ferritin-like metal-binding protein YciE